MRKKLIGELRDNKDKYRRGLIENNTNREAQTLMLGAKSEDIAVLETLGLDHHIKYNQAVEVKLSRTTAIEKIYARESFTGKEIKKLCLKYYLKMLHVDAYNGPVPKELTKAINEFRDENDAVKITTNNFFILAPVKQFEDVKTVKAYGDPILFYREDNNYSSYKTEAETDEVFSQLYTWGDGFSPLRQYHILFDKNCNKMGSDEALSPAARTVMSIMFYILAFMLSILGFPGWGMAFVIIAMIPISTIFMSKQKADKRWNVPN